ncbi:MAG: anhydro-N-acetylmuramic acid kinase [Gammaproteobacteria bacterium]|nr:anhydro-N-acetylmuramic acid kinase [Gammaproteobacteria bacterium]
MLFVGAMTGTSVDGLDLALIDASGDAKPQAVYTTPLPAPLRSKLIALAQPGPNEIELAGEAHVQLGSFIATAVLDFLHSQRLEPNDIRAIGSHGQTIRHHPQAEYPYTVQIGDGNVIAERTAIDVVTDFRGRDIAAGGQGAPLVPIYHQKLFGQANKTTVVLNIGGIANITIIDEQGEVVAGFDTGPGNALMDAWIQACRGEPYDANGDWAQQGRVLEKLLQDCLANAYFAMTPPKSTGKEHFNLQFITDRLQNHLTTTEKDVQATMLELTAQSVTQAINTHAASCQTIVVCGGGRRNGVLMKRMRSLQPYRDICAADDLGVDGDAIEAAAFAYLAWQHIERIPGSTPTITGTKEPRVLGCLYPSR